jgi:SdpI/YfhL protein family
VPAGVGSDLEPVSKFQGLVAGPLLFIGLPIALFLLIARIEPRRAHLWSSAKAYGAIGIAGVVGGLGAHAAFVLRATDRNHALSENLIELVLPILLIVSANYVTKLRSNFFIGIRTPWTLSSEVAWRRTHRVGGRVLMLLGLVLIPPAFVLDAGTNGWVTGLALLGSRSRTRRLFVLRLAKRSDFTLLGPNSRAMPTLMNDHVGEEDLDTAGASIQTFAPGGLWGWSPAEFWRFSLSPPLPYGECGAADRVVDDGR